MCALSKGNKLTSVNLPVDEFYILRTIVYRERSTMRDIIRRVLSQVYPEYREVYEQSQIELQQEKDVNIQEIKIGV